MKQLEHFGASLGPARHDDESKRREAASEAQKAGADELLFSTMSAAVDQDARTRRDKEFRAKALHNIGIRHGRGHIKFQIAVMAQPIRRNPDGPKRLRPTGGLGK